MAIVTSSNIFFGWTQAELESLLAKIKADMLVKGLDWVTSYSINGKTFNKAERISLRDAVGEIRKALRELDSTTYGTAPARVTTADFTNLNL